MHLDISSLRQRAYQVSNRVGTTCFVFVLSRIFLIQKQNLNLKNLKRKYKILLVAEIYENFTKIFFLRFSGFEIFRQKHHHQYAESWDKIFKSAGAVLEAFTVPAAENLSASIEVA